MVFINRRKKEINRAQQQTAILHATHSLIKERKSVWTIEQVQAEVAKNFNFEVSRAMTLSILKRKLKMSYRKIKRVPFQGNSERCKVLRFLWAKEFFSILERGERVITIDETWLPDTDYRSRQWK